MKTEPSSYPKIDLTGQVALVTGAAKGLGKAISLGFSEMGTGLLLVDIDRENVEKVCLDVKEKGSPRMGLELSSSWFRMPPISSPARPFSSTGVGPPNSSKKKSDFGSS
jgi:NAD(P)-dependent dehydrogenase (short-subunit alcohol dehydrogenase family)